MKATAIAHPNIALIKYWGKRDITLNLPAVGSISMTLSGLYTKASVKFRPEASSDLLILNGEPASKSQTQRVSLFFDLFRDAVGISDRVEIVSVNNFPTAAGLASSASAFAAMTVAADAALKLKMPPSRLSEMARHGSGSAARSIFGGFVQMHLGQREDGTDSVAEPIAPADYWDIRLLIVITDEKKKEIGSTAGMEHSRETSPYYASWLATSPGDILEMRQIIADKDFEKLGELAEHSCLKMHSLTLTSRPPILYWNGTTFEVMNAVVAMRKQGIPAWFTIDAGPQVKILCRPEDMERIEEELIVIPGVKHIIRTQPGNGAAVLQDTV